MTYYFVIGILVAIVDVVVALCTLGGGGLSEPKPWFKALLLLVRVLITTVIWPLQVFWVITLLIGRYIRWIGTIEL